MGFLARVMRAGSALTTGLLMVADELPEPMGPEFKTLYDQQNFGLPLPQAMKDSRACPSLDARFFVTAVLTQRESGIDLSEVLDNLAEEIRISKQLQGQAAGPRDLGPRSITGWILSALPTSLAAFFTIGDPDEYREFYMNPLGMQDDGVCSGAAIYRRVDHQPHGQIEY